ncbi:MAG: ABC-2 transporter permease [Oscillospiraceae bacterium]|nr:ABC-2 transporter permease [Oscillospiraceae bacterium]
MLAMLRKDCYVMGKYTVVLIITWAAAAGVLIWFPKTDASFLYYLMPAMSVTIALNAVSTDHECCWDRFAAMTPLRPWQLVLEKYLFTYGTLALMAGLSFLVVWAAASDENSSSIWVAIVLVLLFVDMSLPLVYRFGRQKGGMTLMIFWGLVAALILGAAHWNYGLIETAFGWVEEVPAPALAAGIAVFLAAANAWSFYLSVRFYARRQRGWYD